MIAINIDQIDPPAIICQLTQEQQAAAYRDRTRQQSDAWAESQRRAVQNRVAPSRAGFTRARSPGTAARTSR